MNIRKPPKRGKILWETTMYKVTNTSKTKLASTMGNDIETSLSSAVLQMKSRLRLIDSDIFKAHTEGVTHCLESHSICSNASCLGPVSRENLSMCFLN